MYKTKELFDLDKTIAKEYLEQYEYPWESLKGISDLIIELGHKLNKEEYEEVKENVWIHKSAKVMPSAYIGAPTIIQENVEVRHCAFIRGSAIVGKDSVIGNSCELKNVIICEHVEIPHFNYVGDSILGYKAHMGAGSVTSNFKADHNNILVKDKDEVIETGLRKLGAMIGDYSEIGCNAVLNPGTIVGRNCVIYPTSCVRGTIKENTIYRQDGTTKIKK